MALADDITVKATPYVKAFLQADRETIKATLPPVKRFFFPIVFMILLELIPGIILAIVNHILDNRTEYKL